MILDGGKKICHWDINRKKRKINSSIKYIGGHQWWWLSLKTSNNNSRNFHFILLMLMMMMEGHPGTFDIRYFFMYTSLSHYHTVCLDIILLPQQQKKKKKQKPSPLVDLWVYVFVEILPLPFLKTITKTKLIPFTLFVCDDDEIRFYFLLIKNFKISSIHFHRNKTKKKL